MTELPHGHSKYTNERCRCEICRAENAAYNRKYKQWLRELSDTSKPPENVSVDKGRFVVRSVHGFKIKQGSNTAGNAYETTAFSVNDSMDCYRVVYTAPSGLGSLRSQATCEREAERLNEIHEETLKAVA